MPILWWIWIHNIQERCLLGKDFSLLKAPSLTPSESINISKGRIILINHWQHTISIDVEIEDLFPLSSSPHRLWWRGSGMVDTRRGSGRCHLFLHWVFYWRVFPRCSALRSPLAGTWTWSHRPSRCWPRASSGNTNTAPCPWPTTPAWLLYLCLLHSKPT